MPLRDTVRVPFPSHLWTSSSLPPSLLWSLTFRQELLKGDFMVNHILLISRSRSGPRTLTIVP